MYNRSGIDTYRQTDAHTMTREKLIVLLYEKMVSDVQAALKAATQGNRLGMTKHLSHSQAIISDLRGALDHTIGGDITRNLESIYDYLFHEHLQMLVDLDPAHADNCMRVITPLLESWRKVPVGTGEQAARDYAQGVLTPAPGADPATGQENTGPGPDTGARSTSSNRVNGAVSSNAGSPPKPTLVTVSA